MEHEREIAVGLRPGAEERAGARGDEENGHADEPRGAWSQADSDLAFMLHRLLLNGHELPAKVRAYAEREWQRPSVQEFVTHERAAYVPY